MVFSSLLFLVRFLPIVLILYYISFTHGENLFM